MNIYDIKIKVVSFIIIIIAEMTAVAKYRCRPKKMQNNLFLLYPLSRALVDAFTVTIY